jgi:parallel beta-helix repeat protein
MFRLLATIIVFVITVVSLPAQAAVFYQPFVGGYLKSEAPDFTTQWNFENEMDSLNLNNALIDFETYPDGSVSSPGVSPAYPLIYASGLPADVIIESEQGQLAYFSPTFMSGSGYGIEPYNEQVPNGWVGEITVLFSQPVAAAGIWLLDIDNWSGIDAYATWTFSDGSTHTETFNNTDAPANYFFGLVTYQDESKSLPYDSIASFTFEELGGNANFATNLLFGISIPEPSIQCVSTAAELQAALTAAAVNGRSDIIQIVQGPYEGNFVYDSAQANSLTIEGGYTEGCADRVVAPSNTKLDGGGIGRVLELNAPTVAADFVVDGLTIQNGRLYNVQLRGHLHIETCGRVVLSNSKINDNTTDGNGHGVAIIGADDVDLVSNIITNNTQTGVHIYEAKNVTLIGNKVTHNLGGMDGGGMRIHKPKTVTLDSNIIIGNSGTAAAGAVIDDAETIIVTNNIFSSNNGPNSGGLTISGSEILDVAITNNTFYNNRGSVSCGGGLNLQIHSVTAPSTGFAKIYNNIFWMNQDQSGNDLCLYNTSPDHVLLYNNDFDHSSDGIWMMTTFPIDLSNLNKVDPVFADAANDDYHLTLGSPCRDAGTVPDFGLPPTDFEGDSRICGPAPDIGADEVACFDSDGDGIPDAEDDCPTSDLSGTVVINGCDSGVTNTLFSDGCTISDKIAELAADPTNHGELVCAVAHYTNDLKKDGVITGAEKETLQSCAGESGIVKPPTYEVLLSYYTDEDEKTWLDITLVDEDGNPVPSEHFELTLPSGTVVEGDLDSNGNSKIEITGAVPGDYQVSFPSLDTEGLVKI